MHPVSGSADRLNDYLAEMDAAIAAGQHERAVTLLYTCLEDFYTAFVREKDPAYTPLPEIIALSRWIRDFLRKTLVDYPDKMTNLINHISYAVDRARSRFSEPHFANGAGRCGIRGQGPPGRGSIVLGGGEAGVAII